MTANPGDEYGIEADVAANMMHVRFGSGFWDADVVDRFFGEAIGVAATLPDPVGALTLVDLSAAILQSAEVIAKIQNALLYGTTGWIALVASSPLARMQTRRLQVRDGIRMFGSTEEAEAWLLAMAASSTPPPTAPTPPVTAA